MSFTPYGTANDIPNQVRDKSVALLNQQLVDALDLALQLKHAHWNVKGPQFISLHELFDDLAEESEDFIDEIAERAVELGGVANGTLQAVSSGTRLSPYPAIVAAGREHCASLKQSIGAFSSSTRIAVDSASGWGDAATADLLTQVLRGADKMLWKIEAHLQADA